MKLKQLLLLFCGLLFFVANTTAQELNTQVKVLATAIPNADKQIFTTMEKSIADFMNTRKWTEDEYATNEKIDINILVTLKQKMEGDIYRATLTVQATRPVYNSGYTSPLINFVDRDIVFRYTQFTPLQFNDTRIVSGDAMTSNLTAVLAYYAYMILGLDYDSFAPNGGTAFYKKAQYIVNNAPEEGKSIPGWKAVDGTKNRYWLVDQILNPRFSDVRSSWYALHREGLDNMYSKPEEARKAILQTIPKLSQVNKDNPMSILIQFYFNAKSDEYAKVVAQVPREERAQYTSQLGQMDVPNVAKYQQLNK
jgi:hypothetical protein